MSEQQFDFAWEAWSALESVIKGVEVAAEEVGAFWQHNVDVALPELRL